MIVNHRVLPGDKFSAKNFAILLLDRLYTRAHPRQLVIRKGGHGFLYFLVISHVLLVNEIVVEAFDLRLLNSNGLPHLPFTSLHKVLSVRYISAYHIMANLLT